MISNQLDVSELYFEVPSIMTIIFLKQKKKLKIMKLELLNLFTVVGELYLI